MFVYESCHPCHLLRIVKLKVAKKPDMRNEELVPSERGEYFVAKILV